MSGVKIRLVRSSEWEDLTRTRFNVLQLTPLERRIARWIILTMHGKNVGITPGLAAQAARILTATTGDTRGGRQQDNPWLYTYSRLQLTLEELAVRDMAGTLNVSGFVLNSSMLYTVQAVFLPLVFEACCECGVSYVACEDDHCAALRKGAYEDYERKIDEVVVRLADPEKKAANSKRELWKLFWKDRLLTLLTLTARRSKYAEKPVPAVTLPEARLTLNLEPDFEQFRKAYQGIRISTPHIIDDPMRHDAGADGVTFTRRLEDLDKILVSDRMYPRMIFLDRVANTGFLAIKRPPMPVRLRDLLLVAIFPPEVAALPTAPFVKATWLNFALEVTRLLRAGDMERSELRWISGDSWRRAQSNLLIVESLPDIPNRNDTDNEERIVFSAFLRSTEWYPAYVDLSESVGVIDRAGRAEGNEKAVSASEALQSWMHSVWLAQREAAYWKQAGTRSNSTTRTRPPILSSEYTVDDIDFKQYSHVHIMLFVPASGAAHNSDPEAQTYIYWQRFFRGCTGLSVTAVPDASDKHWTISGYQTQWTEAKTVDLPQWAGLLTINWLNAIIKEMQRG